MFDEEKLPASLQNSGVFQTDTLDDLDKAIQEQASRKSLVKEIRSKKKKKKSQSDELDFWQELQEYWYIYVFLFVSALFTGTLGFYMGLAPYRDGDYIVYNTDAMHIFLAVVYTLAFITVTEGAFVIGKRRFYTRESENNTQKLTGLTIMVISGLSILLTGATGGLVIASQIDFLTSFVEIPTWAQRWVILVIPSLLTLYTFLLTAYHLSSDKAESLRITNEIRDEKALDSQTRRNFVRLAAEESFEQAELKLFVRLVQEGKLSRKQAMKAIENGWSIDTLEKFLGLDLNNDGTIGGENKQPSQLGRQAAYAADTSQEALAEDNNRPS